MNEIEKAQWHYKIGKEFEDAFYILIGKYSAAKDKWGTIVERPSYYCAGLATEHYIKAYLVLNGIEFPTNHKGHDLSQLILLGKENIKIFFDFNKIDVSQITVLNERYYSHSIYGKDDLRYGNVVGLRISPHPDVFDQILKKMNSRIFTEIRVIHEVSSSK